MNAGKKRGTPLILSLSLFILCFVTSIQPYLYINVLILGLIFYVQATLEHGLYFFGDDPRLDILRLLKGLFFGGAHCPPLLV